MSGYESDTCGRSYTIRIRYVWTQIFLYPHKKNLRIQNLRIRVDGASIRQAIIMYKTMWPCGHRPFLLPIQDFSFSQANQWKQFYVSRALRFLVRRPRRLRETMGSGKENGSKQFLLTHSLPWINDYRSFVIFSEFTIIVNLKDWKLDRIMGNGHIFFNSENPSVWI